MRHGRKKRSTALQVDVVAKPLTATSPAEQTIADLYDSAVHRMVAHVGWVLPEDRAWDVVHDTTLDLVRDWHQLAPENKNAGYFLAAVHNDLRDALRKRARRERRQLRLPETEAEQYMYPELVSQSPLAVMEAESEYEYAFRLAQQLPTRVREVWTLCRHEGMSPAEAAGFLGISVKTVYAHLGRATKLMHALFDEPQPTPGNARVRAMPAASYGTEVDDD